MQKDCEERQNKYDSTLNYYTDRQSDHVDKKQVKIHTQ